MEIVIAVIMLLNSETSYEYQSNTKMTINECLEQARDFNSDPDHPYIMVCMPDLSREEV